MVVNVRAGAARRVARDIARHLPAARIDLVDDPACLSQQLVAASANARAIGVAGGDGSVRAAAAVAAERGVPLAVFPAGTLNHFALDVGVRSVTAAAAAVRAGHAAAVEFGTVNGEVFVNTASIGGYPELVRSRGEWQRRVGRWPALAIALLQVLRDARPVPLSIDGVPLRAWLLFVGNGVYHPPGFAPAWRSDLVDGLLDVRVVRADRAGARSRVFLAALTGTLPRSSGYVATGRDKVVVDLDEPRELAVDGEVLAAVTRAEFGKGETPLVVYRPSDRDLSAEIRALPGPA